MEWVKLGGDATYKDTTCKVVTCNTKGSAMAGDATGNATKSKD